MYFEHIMIPDISINYYWTNNWSEYFYIQLAEKGFITTTYEAEDTLILLPELQFAYSILDFQNLHLSKKVQKLLKKEDAYLSFNTRLPEVIQKISLQHKDNWMQGFYTKLMQSLHEKTYKNFELVSVELISKEDNSLIAGEIGYVIGSSYTSLSGFSSRKKQFNNYGTLQLVLLAQHLEKRNFSFWNLGHPFMEYKQRLGAIVHQRKEFLQRWNQAVKHSQQTLYDTISPTRNSYEIESKNNKIPK